MIDALDDEIWPQEGELARAELFFALPPLTRYLYRFGECLTPRQRDRVESLLASPRDIFGHGTLNHASMTATSYYLLASMFKNVVWHDKSGHSFPSAQVVGKLRQLLQSSYLAFVRNGNYEQFSPTYTIVNDISALNLADLAPDDTLRSLASAYLNISLALRIANSFHGSLLSPVSRANYEQRNGEWGSESSERGIFMPQVFLWYYTGVPSVRRRDLDGVAVSAMGSILALSSWRPEPEIVALSERGTHYPVATKTPAFSYWGAPAGTELFGRATVDPDYAISTGNFRFDPAGYNDHTALFTIFYRSRRFLNSIDCRHPYYNSNLGEKVWRTDRASPFQETFLSGDRGVLLYDIPKADPWTYGPDNRFFKQRDARRDDLLAVAECRFPRDIDEKSVTPDGVFLREGNVYIGFRPLAGRIEPLPDPPSDGLAAYNAFAVRRARTGYYFRVGTAQTDGSFDQFRASFVRDQFEFDEARVGVTYRDRAGKRISVTYNRSPVSPGLPGSPNLVESIPAVMIDGAPQSLDFDGYFSSPSVHAGPRGVTVTGAGGRLTFTAGEDGGHVERSAK